ncbi:MAG TPA: mercuric reductase [Rudaea sp.]|jgi:pyruvate/2-oxoglutarate dehydrogenase complex dihydrolipoamide dehydrogenase (E3) component
MSPRDEAPASVSADAHECERVANMLPPGWHNPQPDGLYQLAIIGAGPAGIAAAELAASLGARVALIERTAIGGVNLNTGSVPSKTLIRTSRIYADMRDAPHYGADIPVGVDIDFVAAMQRVRRVRARLSRDDSARRLTAAGVDVYFGDARFVTGDTLTVDGRTLGFRKALITTGARPHIPNIPGLAQAGYLTDENLFELTELPRRLLVIGGGPLGCEQAQAFCRLGAQTTIVQNKPLFLGQEERDAAQILSEAFVRDGIEVRLNTTALAVRMTSGAKLVDLLSDDYRDTIGVDAILTGAGRTPNVEGLNLAAVGIDCHAGGRIRVDDFMRTGNSNVYAAGDVCLENRFVDAATASARIAVQNALLRRNRRWSAVVVPSCTYTDPEIARVGLSVREANRLGIPVKTFTIPMHEIDRAVTDSETAGFVKVHVRGRTDRILGATIVARHAGDMINEITLAMVAGIGLRTLSCVLHAYPTQAEAIRQAADAYNRTRLTPRVRSRLLRRIGS